MSSWDSMTSQISYISQKIFLSELNVIHQFSRNSYVIKVNDYEIDNIFREGYIHGPLEGGHYIHQSERHFDIHKGAPRCGKSSFDLITWEH